MNRIATTGLGLLVLGASLAAQRVEPVEAGGAADAAAFTVQATLATAEWIVGEEIHVVVEIETEGSIHKEFFWERPRPDDALRRPLLFIDAPDALQPIGEAPADMVTPLDYQQTYLRMPWGRRLLTKRTTLPFRLLAEPPEGATLGLNVTTYFDGATSEQARFVRLRIELPLVPGASALARPSRQTAWGDHGTLAVGDTAPDFELPTTVGVPVRLTEVMGDGRALILAYRGAT